MRVIMFQARFEEPIQRGLKGSTIRRTARCKPGDELSLRVWTGKPYRSKHREIIPKRTCLAVRPVRMHGNHEKLLLDLDGTVVVDPTDLHYLAQKEGFTSWSEMQAWFCEVHHITATNPFTGMLIEWR